MEVTSTNTDVNGLIDDLVARYNAFGKASAKGILGLAETICQAHEELGGKYLGLFYERIKVRPSGSTSRKLRKIGENSARFAQVLEKLPGNWTVLYVLAKMEADQFRQLVEHDVLHPLVSLQAIETHLIQPAKGFAEAPQRLSLDLNQVKAQRRRDFAKRLKSLFEEFEVTLGKTQAATLDSLLTVPNGTGNVKEEGSARAAL